MGLLWHWDWPIDGPNYSGDGKFLCLHRWWWQSNENVMESTEEKAKPKSNIKRKIFNWSSDDED
jgi:hypothetical protein